MLNGIATALALDSPIGSPSGGAVSSLALFAPALLVGRIAGVQEISASRERVRVVQVVSVCVIAHADDR